METARIGPETGSIPQVGRQMSIYGALFFLVLSIVASILTSGLAGVVVLAYVVCWSVLLSSDVVNTIRRRRFWFFVVSMMVVGTLAMGGEKDLSVAGVALSSEGLGAGVSMALRAATIVVATTAFSRMASIGGLSALFARLGVGEIGFLLGVAVNLLPLIQSTTADVLLAMRLRGGFRRHKIASLKRMVVTILVNSVRYSEDIVCAAEARAFGGVHPVPAPIPITSADRLLFGTSAVLAVLLALMKIQLG